MTKNRYLIYYCYARYGYSAVSLMRAALKMLPRLMSTGGADYFLQVISCASLYTPSVLSIRFTKWYSSAWARIYIKFYGTINQQPSMI